MTLAFKKDEDSDSKVMVPEYIRIGTELEIRGEDNNKTITLEGKADCAATGQRDVPMRTVFRVHGPDKHTFEMYDESKGRNAKTMEIIYTRA